MVSWQDPVPNPIPFPGYSSLPCIPHACSSHLTSSSCIDLSVPEASTVPARPRPRVLLKAPTLAEMEEMSISEVKKGLWWGCQGGTG